jgi:hypothetical protein
MFDCPVCGYPKLDEPPYDEHKCPTYIICPSCGTEFGYDDATVEHLALRQRWIANGMRWWSAATPPPVDWEPLKQLRMTERTG